MTRTALEHILDHACDGPRRLKRTIAALLGVGVSLLALGWALGRG